eukprot:6178625-Pleurochrysis_carterae.AAC.1
MASSRWGILHLILALMVFRWAMLLGPKLPREIVGDSGTYAHFRETCARLDEGTIQEDEECFEKDARDC